MSDAQALADLREYADLRDWIGPYSIILREAAADLGTVDGVTYRVEITDTSFFLQMPDEAFAFSLGTEWFIEPGVAGPPRTDWIFA